MTFLSLTLAQQAVVQQSAGQFGPMWETAKGVMLTLTTAGVLWIARMLFGMRDVVRDLDAVVRGRDGDKGLKGKAEELEERVGAIEDRNLAIDVVAKLEKDEYDGDERRHGLRSLRELIREEIAKLHLPRKASS